MSISIKGNFTRANENSKKQKANCVRRGKTKVKKSRPVLVLCLIARWIGAIFFFFDQSQYTVKPDQRHFGDTTQHIRCVLLLLTNRWGPLLRSNKRLWFIILRMSYACRAYRVRRGDGSFDTLIITSITTTCQTTVSYSNYIKKTFPNLFHNKIKTMLKNLLCERLQLLSQAYQNWWRPWQ